LVKTAVADCSADCSAADRLSSALVKTAVADCSADWITTTPC
jgi:hypothetical protein